MLLEEMESKIVDMYSDNYSILRLSKIFGCSDRPIKRILLKHGVSIKDNNWYKSKKVNHKFFDKIDSEAKAYILGFIYADGCLTKGNILSFHVSEVDKEILFKIRTCLGSDHSIGTYKNTSGYYTENNYCSLQITSKHMHDTLVALGAIERKTKSLTFPTWLDTDLIHHFIRGFFDGDGSVYEVSQNNFLGCSFIGTYDMMLNIKNILHSELGTNTNVTKYKNKDIYEYHLGGRNIVTEFYKYLYEDATIFLSRKKDKFDKYLKAKCR